MSISVIAAVASDGAIGRGGDMPFHIREDLRRFKAITMGHPLVMGRKTFDSLPGGALPGRRNIVVTRNAEWRAEGAETAGSLREAIEKCAENEEIMIMGGGEIYQQAMPQADKLYLTEIDAEVADADTFFPAFDRGEWVSTYESEPAVDPRSGATYRFVDYVRK